MAHFKAIVQNIASEKDVEIATVRKVSLALLKKFASLIEYQENFFSPVVTFRSKSVTPKTEGGQAGGEQKFARMTICDTRED